MQKTINSKHKKILLETIRNYFNNQLIDAQHLSEFTNSIIKKSNLTVNNEQVNEYLQKYIHRDNENNKIFIDINKRKIIKKNILLIDNLKDNLSGNIKIIENNIIDEIEIIDASQNINLGIQVVNTTEQINGTYNFAKENTEKNINNINEDNKEPNLVTEESEKSNDTTLTANTEDLEQELSNLINQGNNDKNKYTLPKENKYEIVCKKEEHFGPFGSQWINEIQRDDIIDKIVEKRIKTLRFLMALPFYDQVKDKNEWLKQRENKITASDVGTVLGNNKYEAVYKFILKKVGGSTFFGNKNTYHGKKYENVATMIYEYRKNVIVREFGLIEHQKLKFLGASPDGIITEYKKDNIHKTKFAGCMLEIKCPQLRKIKTDGELIDGICPIYYYDQVQLQLECCDLDDCDFWQCNIHEYFSRREFLNDTDPTEPFRSKETGFEKGALIQLVLKSKAKDALENYWDTIYNNTKFIYPDKIEMTPHEIDIWVMDKLEELKYKKEYMDYYVDRVIYWRLNNAHCCTIPRDKKWFENNLPTMRKIWGYVEFFKKNPDKYKILTDFIDSLNMKKNDVIMQKVESICDLPNTNDKKKMDAYNDKINSICCETQQKINDNKIKMDKKKCKTISDYGFEELDDKNNYNTYLF